MIFSIVGSGCASANPPESTTHEIHFVFIKDEQTGEKLACLPEKDTQQLYQMLGSCR